MNPKIEKLLQNLLLFVISLVGELVVLPVYGLVLSTIWSWFFVSLGLPVLSISVAIAVCIIADLLKGVDFEDLKAEESEQTVDAYLADMVNHLGYRLGLAGILFAMAWFVHIW